MTKPEENIPQAVVISPLTEKNIAKSSFRIQDVSEYFNKAADYLNNLKMNFDKNYLKREINIVSEFLKCVGIINILDS